MITLKNVPFTEITLEGKYVVKVQEDEGMGFTSHYAKIGTGREVFEYLKEVLEFDQEEIDELDEMGKDWLEEAIKRNKDTYIFILVYPIT
jgi:hypothetical protein